MGSPLYTDEELATLARPAPTSADYSDQELLDLAEQSRPTHVEVLQQSLGPDVRVRPVQGFGEGLFSTTLRGVASVASDTRAGQIGVMDDLARLLRSDARVYEDPTTNQPVLQYGDGQVIPLEIPGFFKGGPEVAGDVAETLAPSIPAEAGAVAGGLGAAATLGPGAVPYGILLGAMGFEGLRQSIQHMTGIDEESLDQMLATVGIEGAGQLLGLLVPRFFKGTARAAGTKIGTAGEEALAAEKRLAAQGIEFGLTPAELGEGAFSRLGRQVAILSSRAQAFFRDRSVRLSAMLTDLPDPQMRGRLRDFIEKDFADELDRQQLAVFDASRAMSMGPEQYKEVLPAWRKMMVERRTSSQAAVSGAYRRADELMLGANLRENYFYPGSPGDELFDEIASLRASNQPLHPELNRLVRRMEQEVETARKQGVRGWVGTQRSGRNILTGEEFGNVYTPREKLRDYAEQLYDVADNESLPGLARSQARSLRHRVLESLDAPQLEPIPGLPGDPDMAREAIDQLNTARRMAKDRFEKLEQEDLLGLRPNNPEPVKTLQAITKAQNLDQLYALARYSGGMEMARDAYFTELLADPRMMGKALLEADPRVMLELIGERADYGRLRQAAHQIENLRASGAWEALERQSRDVPFARDLLFGQQSARRDLVQQQIARAGGPDSELGRAAEAAVVAELISRSIDEAKPGADIAAESLHKHLRQLEREGVLDFVRPAVRQILRDSSTVATFANLSRPDSGSSLEAASTVARLRSSSFLKGISQLGIAEGLALVLTNPRATDIYKAAIASPGVAKTTDLLFGAVSALLTRAAQRESREGGAEPSGIY